jgi:hypothetical protein
VKYVDETDRAITEATRVLRVPNARDAPEVVGELIGSAHPKLRHLRCLRIELSVKANVMDALTRDNIDDPTVFIREARIVAYYEVSE